MQRLRQRADFLAAATGAKAPVTGFVLQALKRREDGPVRVGFTVSKKVGNAVERNRVRRRLREVVRLAPPDQMRQGHDYVLVGRRAALDLPFGRLIEDLGRAVGRVHVAAPESKQTDKQTDKRTDKGAGRGTGGRPSPTPHAGTK
jgi:ribonuclease P protein component